MEAKRFIASRGLLDTKIEDKEVLDKLEQAGLQDCATYGDAFNRLKEMGYSWDAFTDIIDNDGVTTVAMVFRERNCEIRHKTLYLETDEPLEIFDTVIREMHKWATRKDTES